MLNAAPRAAPVFHDIPEQAGEELAIGGVFLLFHNAQIGRVGSEPGLQRLAVERAKG